MPDLSKQQSKLLAYLKTHNPPTLAELAVHLRVSRETVRQHLQRLEKKKLVRVLPRIPRGIEVLP